METGNIWKGVAVGAVSGLLGSWAMLLFSKGVGRTLLDTLKSEEDRAWEQRLQERDGADNPDSVTMQAADAFAAYAPGGRRLRLEERKQGGALVHYGFGMAMGMAYGGLAEIEPRIGAGVGVPFGTILWASTDLLSLPAVGFAKWPKDEPAAAHITHWMAHVIFALGMEATRRAGRRLW